MVPFGHWFVGFMFGVLVGLLFTDAVNAAWDRIAATLHKRKNRRVERRKFSIASYMELSKHNDQNAVDRLFGLKRRW